MNYCRKNIYKSFFKVIITEVLHLLIMFILLVQTCRMT
jgi:hypothetical protein